jgi:hypothetical protein
MLTALDAPIDILDEGERKFIEKIRKHGWVNTAVLESDDGPNFSYTTGMYVNAAHPEVIMFGMKREIMHDVFWGVFREVGAEDPLPVGVRTDRLFSNLPAYVFPVATRHYEAYLGWNRWFYAGDNFPCLQVVWPDRSGIFPWERDFDTAFADDQTDLTESGWSAAIQD